MGRFVVQKDYPNMIRAFHAATGGADGAARSACLLLAGTGPLESEMRDLAGKLGVGDRVRFLGVRSDAPALLNSADAASMTPGPPPVTIRNPRCTRNRASRAMSA